MRKRLPGRRVGVKGGGRSVAVPAVKSMADVDPVAPSTASGAGDSEHPPDGPDDELTRTIKAAYQ
ncbi:hypothetical protein [Reyranella sp.]|uniref:hypothetical protein n=1 Tax=Reyranella sp. TaxID=1929291 RepID=UPI003BAB78E6